jgi:ubiquinone/menaquinone biosynthesis C-methylase UbiE
VTGPTELSEADAAVVDSVVVPRYLSLYGELMLELFLAGEGARVAHLGCRTGYPDDRLVRGVPNSSLVGVDSSAAALERARIKAGDLGELDLSYVQAVSWQTGLDDASFSHVVTLHPPARAEHRARLFREAGRLLCAAGQALVALPLRGSFQELFDLLREYALKHDDAEFGNALEQAASAHPTMETLTEELEAAGFDDVDVELRTTALAFDSGRGFVEDPATRLFILPDLAEALGGRKLDQPASYLRDAIDKYWSEAEFELGLSVGCASGRKTG